MFGRNKPKYQMVTTLLAKVELETSGTLSAKARQEIINATYEQHFSEIVGYEPVTNQYGEVVEEKSWKAPRGEAIWGTNLPEGYSWFGIIVTVACFLLAVVTNKGGLPDPAITNDFLTITGNKTRSLSTILLLLSIMFALPMIRKANIAYIVLCVLLALDSFSGMRGSTWPWVALVVFFIYYRIVRRQMKSKGKLTEQQVKAEINAEIDQFLIPEWRRKLNRRNI